MAQSDIHDEAAAYALDALDPEDRWTFERHLDTCTRCREEVAGLRDIASELAHATEGPEPSPDLRERILEAARAEPRTATVVPMPRRRWLLPATAAAAVAAACAAIGLGLWANSLREQPQRVVALQGVPGQLVVSDDKASLVLCLDETPAAKTYEAWVIADGGRPQPAGLFAGGCRSVRLDEPVDRGDVVAITLEPEGGSPQPTSDILGSANV